MQRAYAVSEAELQAQATIKRGYYNWELEHD